MLANVALTDTFDTWRIRTNQLVIQSGQAYELANAAYEATNTAVIDAANITANILSSNTLIQNLVYDATNSAIDVIAANITNTLASNDYIIGLTTDAANAAIANLEIVVFDVANASYATANDSYMVADAAFGKANDSYIVANSAFDAANAAGSSVKVNAAFSTANAAFDAANAAGSSAKVNAAFVVANAAYISVNTAFAVANAAFGTANGAVSNTTGAFNRVNSAFTVANASFGVANLRFDVTNSAFTVANAAFGTANAAFDKANTYAQLVEIIDESSNNGIHYVTFSSTSSGNTGLNVSSSKLTFNPYDGTLSSTSFNSLSDASMKDNVEPISNALDTINRINGVSFDWKETGKHSFGVIAQDVEKIVPELVDSINSNKTVNYDGIIAFLIEAIKELNRKLEEKQ